MVIEFPESTWDTRLVLLQEAIVQRFGFIACVVESRKSSRASYKNSYHHHHQYVHVTGRSLNVNLLKLYYFYRTQGFYIFAGNIFILIPSTPCSRLQEKTPQTSSNSESRFYGSQQSPRRYNLNSDVVCSPHEEYITRHVYGTKRDYNGADSRVCVIFLL